MVSKVVIVGGGTSGWMTAAYLASTIGRVQHLEIVLVESADIGVIGVGEATIPTLVSMLKDIDVSEEEFLVGVNGAFKQAIRFQNWRTDPDVSPSYFYHPFHKGRKSDLHAALQYLSLNPDYPGHAFAQFSSPQTMACDANLSPKGLAASAAGEGADFPYAYHMDAVLFGQFLRAKFEGRRVRRIEGLVTGAQLRGDGAIDAIVLRGGEKIQGDLFIDCSGFRGLLINQHLNVPFESFSRWLPCDRAVAVSAPYAEGERIRPYTLATAQKAGWIWDINLASRRGVGHVYSSSHQSEDEAGRTVLSYIGGDDSRLELRHIKMRVGCNQKLWEKNCVAIGLSGGFIEPLESTGIYLTEMGVRHLIDNWPVGGDADVPRRHAYNKRMRHIYDEILRFVLMHYVTSERRDSVFWRDITSLPELPSGLAEMLQLCRYKYPTPYDVTPMEGSIFGHESYIAILAGMRYFKGVSQPLVRSDVKGLGTHLRARVDEYKHLVDTLPSHEAYLKSVREMAVRRQGLMRR